MLHNPPVPWPGMGGMGVSEVWGVWRVCWVGGLTFSPLLSCPGRRCTSSTSFCTRQGAWYSTSYTRAYDILVSQGAWYGVPRAGS